MNQIDRELAANPEQLRELFREPIQYGEQLSFLLDSNVDHKLVGLLAEVNLSAITAQAEGIDEWKSDFKMLQYATVRGRVLVSNDKDYREINKVLNGLNIMHAGIIYVKTVTAQRQPEMVANYIIERREADANSFAHQIVQL